MQDEAEPPQIDKFKALARELEADEDEASWDERLARVVAHRPSREPDQRDEQGD